MVVSGWDVLTKQAKGKPLDKRVECRMSEEDLTALQALADADMRSVGNTMRMLVRQEMDRRTYAVSYVR